MVRRRNSAREPEPFDGRIGNYGYIVLARPMAKLAGKYEWYSKLDRLFRYHPPPTKDVNQPQVLMFEEHGETADEANRKASARVEAWIRSQLESGPT